jgi:hypothetical protein
MHVWVMLCGGQPKKRANAMRRIPCQRLFLSLAECSVPFLAMAVETNHKTRENKKEWGEPVEGQVISIATNGTEFAPETPILLTVWYKNVGPKPVSTLFTGNEFVMYDIKVVSPDGKEIPKTLYGKLRSEAPTPGYVATSETQPGEEQSRDGIPLSRCFDFSGDGTYTIVVRQTLLQRGKDGEALKATSNRHKITINGRLTKEPHSKPD